MEKLGGRGHTSFAVTPRVVFTSSKVGQDSGKERRMSPFAPPPQMKPGHYTGHFEPHSEKFVLDLHCSTHSK